MLRTLLYLFLSCHILLLSCGRPAKRVVNETDFESLVATKRNGNSKLAGIDTEMKFWSARLQHNNDDIAAKLKLAALFRHRFDYSGNISEIHTADSFYRAAHSISRLNSSSTFRSLAFLSITRHEFRQAKLYLDSALHMGDDKHQTILGLVDVHMELGEPYLAEKALSSLADKNDVQYMIRLAKIKDHKGNLEQAIDIMEQAATKLQNEHDPLYLWVHSNLADMYSHANRFEAAYSEYLEVLRIDPGSYHCFKGIAWLAFSHDGNTALAKKILLFLKRQHAVPDYDLLLAEIAEYEGDKQTHQRYIGSFLSAARNPAYGNMYNQYVCELQAEVIKDKDAALRIARLEVENRPTASSFASLAWAYYHSNETERSLDIARSYLENKTSEPGILYKIGMIYHATGDESKAKKYLSEANESAYELGPLVAARIKTILKAI